MLSELQIQEHYAGWDLNDEERFYLAFHARRLAYGLSATAWRGLRDREPTGGVCSTSGRTS